MTALAQQLPEILQRNSSLLPRILNYVLVVLIAVSSDKLAWGLFATQNATETVSDIKAAPPRLVKPAAPNPDYDAQLARLHLMGKASIANNSVAADQNAPDTSLN